MTSAKFSDFLTPSPLLCIFTQPPLLSFLTASAFGVPPSPPPSLCRHHMYMPPYIHIHNRRGTGWHASLSATRLGSGLACLCLCLYQPPPHSVPSISIPPSPREGLPSANTYQYHPPLLAPPPGTPSCHPHKPQPLTLYHPSIFSTHSFPRRGHVPHTNWILPSVLSILACPCLRPPHHPGHCPCLYLSHRLL